MSWEHPLEREGWEHQDPGWSIRLDGGYTLCLRVVPSTDDSWEALVFGGPGLPLISSKEFHGPGSLLTAAGWCREVADLDAVQQSQGSAP